MTKRAQILLFGALLVLWAGIIAVRVATEPEPQRVPLKFVSGKTVARDTARSSGVPAITKPMPATTAQVVFDTAQVVFKPPKNIFAPLDVRTDEAREADARARLQAAKKKAEQVAAAARPPAPVAPPPPTPEELAAQEEKRKAELARQQKEQAIQQARQAMGQYRFLGYLTEAGEHRAFLGKGKDIYIVRTGETIEGKIQVKSIDPAAVKLQEQTTTTETSLPLTKEGG